MIKSKAIEGGVLTHLDANGRARMVDVGEKAVTRRRARARCEIRMRPEILKRLREGQIAKGDALTVAKTAGFLAVKKTAELIPLCHPLTVDFIDIRFLDSPDGLGLVAESEVSCEAKTGVEMEALAGAAVAALTLYDMIKSYGPEIVITNLRLSSKTGGKTPYEYTAAGGDPDRQ